MDFNFEEIESTQTWARENLDRCPTHEVSFVVAKSQTKGRGQFERSWLSPTGNIYLTMVFKLKDFDSKKLSLDTGHAVLACLEELGFNPTLKWPNDIFLNGMKLGGILIETVPVDDFRMALVGVGINVNLDDVSKIDQPATSLKIVSKKAWDVENVLALLKNNLTQKLSPVISSK